MREHEDWLESESSTYSSSKAKTLEVVVKEASVYMNVFWYSSTFFNIFVLLQISYQGFLSKQTFTDKSL